MGEIKWIKHLIRKDRPKIETDVRVHVTAPAEVRVRSRRRGGDGAGLTAEWRVGDLAT